jgi:hypothetical protein
MGEVRFGRGPRWISGQPRRQGTDLRAGSLFRAVLNMRIPVPMSTPAAKQRVREYVFPRVARIWRYSTMAAMAILCHRPYQRPAHPLHCGSPIQAESTGWVQGRDDRGQVAEYLTVFVVNLEIGSGWRLWLSEDICFANSRRYVRTGLFAGRVTVGGGVMRSPGLMAALGRVICSVPRGST